MTPALCRAARHLVGWTQTDLANSAGLALRTVQRYEDGHALSVKNVARIRKTLSQSGIAFVEGGGVEGLIKPR